MLILLSMGWHLYSILNLRVSCFCYLRRGRNQIEFTDQVWIIFLVGALSDWIGLRASIDQEAVEYWIMRYAILGSLIVSGLYYSWLQRDM